MSPPAPAAGVRPTFEDQTVPKLWAASDSRKEGRVQVPPVFLTGPSSTIGSEQPSNIALSKSTAFSKAVTHADDTEQALTPRHAVRGKLS